MSSSLVLRPLWWSWIGASVVFLALGFWGTRLVPVGHEELSTFPSNGFAVLDSEFVLQPSCKDPQPPLFVRSEARPMLALCAGGLTLPVLVAPYSSGIPYWHATLGWHFHGGHAFGLRRWNLFSGLMALGATILLVRRFAGPLAAAATAPVMALGSPFVILHVLLMQYESLPWLLTVAGLLSVAGWTSPASPSTRRMVVAGACWGLAFLANIKAVFFFAPILIVAWRMGILRRGKAVLFVALGIPWALVGGLLFLANGIHRGGGIQSQTASRLDLLLRPTTLSDIVGEVSNMLRFASDTGSYTALEWEPFGALGVLAAVASALGAAYVVFAAARMVIGRKFDPLAAFCGLAVLEFIGVSLKLYDQIPKANYAPLYAVFAIMVGMAISSGAEMLARVGVPGLRHSGRNALAMTLLVALPMGATTFGRIARSSDTAMSFATRAELELTDYLLEHPLQGAPIYTTTYNFAGVLDSLGRGELRSIRLDRTVYCSPQVAVAERCYDERWRGFLSASTRFPVRIVLPVSFTLSDEDNAMLLRPALERVSAELGLEVEQEYLAKAGDGTPAMALVRVTKGVGGHLPAAKP